MRRLQLVLESLAKGGEAVGRAADGRVVFVDGGVPGDRALVELTEDKARYARGRIVDLLERGPDRVTPPCEHAETCGGCPWQNVSDAAQARAKTEIVARALQSFSVVQPLVPSPGTLGYRQRVTMYAQNGVIGFYARRTHRLVDLDRCIALDPRLDDAVRMVRALDGGALARALGQQGSIRATIVQSGSVHVALQPGRGADRSMLEHLATAAVEAGIAGVLVLADRASVAFGEVLVDGGAAGAPHWVSAAGFRQAQHAQNETLRRMVKDALACGGKSLLELYAGDGNFTRDAVGRAHHIVAVEEDQAAIARLKRSLPTVEAIAAKSETEILRRSLSSERFDCVLLDPPRDGAKEVMAPLLRLAPDRIVYVSCDAATLARDLQRMVVDYDIEAATPVDMMPHTDHVEVVVDLRRRERRP